MQGQRSAIGSLPETLSFDHGSATGDAAIDQQICWNNMRNPEQDHSPDYIMTSSDNGLAYLTPANQGRHNLSSWTLGESNSHAPQDQMSQNERRAENGWPSSVNVRGGASLISEEQRFDPARVYSANRVNVSLSNNQNAASPFPIRSPDTLPQDIDMNSGLEVNEDDDCQILECPNAYKSAGSAEGRPSASSSSFPFGMPPGSGGFLVDESDGRAGCSLDGRRLSCKRKAFEGNAGPSSASGTSSFFQPAESSVWHSVPARQHTTNAATSTSAPVENTVNINFTEPVNPRLGLSVGGTASESPLTLNSSGSGETSSRRNFRLRINALHRRESVSNGLLAEGDAGNLNDSSVQQSSRLQNNPLEVIPTSVADSGSSQGHSARVPSLRRYSHSRWNGASSSRTGSSSSLGMSGLLDASAYEESNPRSVPRDISEHPMFIPASERRNSSLHHPSWSLNGGNVSTVGNVASTSRAGSSSRVHSSAPTWVGTHRNPPHYPRRLSEIVRRSLLSADGDGQSSNHTPLRSGLVTSPEIASASSSGSHGHHPSSSRSALLLDRHIDSALGIPYSLRAASEGRSRLVSEIRNVLDLVRRGEGLRVEDVMLLDQSVFFGMADVHDRHRDMRLDVDNMSYEELLALEERIGNVSTGLSGETISSRLKRRKYVDMKIEGQAETEPCCVCQEEYSNGEDVGTLDCGHDFHAECIKQWLTHKNLCPICKTTGLAT